MNPHHKQWLTRLDSSPGEDSSLENHPSISCFEQGRGRCCVVAVSLSPFILVICHHCHPLLVICCLLSIVCHLSSVICCCFLFVIYCVVCCRCCPLLVVHCCCHPLLIICHHCPSLSSSTLSSSPAPTVHPTSGGLLDSKEQTR